MLERFSSFLETEKQYSKLTISSYKRDISQFLNFIEVAKGACEINEISHKDIRMWVMHLSEGRYANTSINRKISALKSFFKYFNEIGVVGVDPTMNLITLRKGRVLPKFVEGSVMEKMVLDMLNISDEYFQERDSMMILLLYATGVRVSELTEVKTSDFASGISSIKVKGKGSKERIIPIISELKSKIKNLMFLRNNICNNGNKLLFLSNSLDPINRSAVYRIVSKKLTLYGVDGKRGPHVLRHTFATHLLGNGAGIETVKELLGHKSLATTQVYTHNNIEQLKDIYQKSHPRGRNK